MIAGVPRVGSVVSCMLAHTRGARELRPSFVQARGHPTSAGAHSSQGHAWLTAWLGSESACVAVSCSQMVGLLTAGVALFVRWCPLSQRCLDV